MTTAITPAQAAAEMLARKKARASLDGFAEYALKVKPALHHRVICEHIQRLILDDEWDDLIILSPPGSAKSTYTSIALPPFAIGTSPTPINLLTCSYSTELAERWSRKIRGLLSQEEITTLFPNTTLSKDSAAAGRWATERGDELYAAGVGSGILGFRADLAIIDDPISGFEQAQSITQLTKVHEWFETDFVTRLKPKAKLVLICQRLARNDLAGYLIDRNEMKQTRRQKILRLKMEAEEDDPLGREPGEYLWPEWFTEQMVEDAKRDEFKWKTLYQQEPPADTGSWVAPDEVQIVDIVPSNVSRYMMSDLALSVNSGDYSVHGVAGVCPQGNIYLEEVWRDRCSVEKTVEKHLDMVDTYSPMESLIDDDNMAKVYVHLLATRARERQISVPWKTLPMRGQDKETRAAPLRGMFKRRKVFLKRAEWNRWFVNEIMQFPNALGEGVDDGVDMFGLIGRRLAMLARPAQSAPPRPPMKTVQQATLDELWEEKEQQRKLRRI